MKNIIKTPTIALIQYVISKYSLVFTIKLIKIRDGW